MRIFYDTEFTSLDGNVDWELISAGFVIESGEELYIEITDFPIENCSDFVHETVLPLLGQGGIEPIRLPGDDFSGFLCQWLQKFNQPIELISDAACDWHLVNGYCYSDFKTMPNKISGELWMPSESPITAIRLAAHEERFWSRNPGMQHHAMFDARRLKLLAEMQRDIQHQLSTESLDDLDDKELVARTEILRRGEDW